ncbi:MAG: glycoside hydrolase family 97 protein [Rikenellaceae bacterium]
MKKILLIALSAAIISACSNAEEGGLKLSSPNTKNQIEFEISKCGELRYSISNGSLPIIAPSKMGFKFKDSTLLAGDFELLSSSRDTYNETWETIWGQQQRVKNHYNELTFNLRQISSNILLNITARAFDDGVAFRYEFPKQSELGEFTIMDELTEFNFANDFKSWWGYADYDNYEKVYYTSPISEIGDIDKYARRPDKEEMERMSNTPMTVEINQNLAVCLHEAELIDYPDMSLERVDGYNLKCHLTPWLNGDRVRTSAPMKSPWRTFQIGSAAEIAVSDMLMNLNAPCVYDDTSWIETYKYIGIWWEIHIGKSSWARHTQWGEPIKRPHGATTENAKRHIDFAAKHGIPEVLVEGWDQGWDDMNQQWSGYGIFDWKTSTDDYDLEEVCRYAKQKGVRIMMYFETISDIDHFEPAMDDLFAMCNRLGIKTAKVGYTGHVNYDDERNTYREHHHGQYMVRHYNNMIRTAAKNKVMVVNHEPIKYTGEQRTYPNIMCREGARGQEYNAWSDGNSPEHTVVLPFTRMVSGPMDYTPGIFKMHVRDKKTSWRDCDVKSTLCKEMALMLTLYSPIVMAADLPENYEGNAAFQFIKDMPTDWSRSKVLNAKIGDYYTIARQEKGTDNWYIGSVSDENGRNFEFDLDFLAPNSTYRATVYADGEDAHWQENPESVRIDEFTIKSGDKLRVKLAPGGGQAIQLIKL